MASSVILRNLKRLEKSLQKNIDYSDLNHEGIENDLGKDGMILEKGSAVLNAYKMWLKSRSTSYIRNSGYGGFLTEEIHTYPFTAESEQLIVSRIKELTRQEWPNINLIACEVKCMSPKKYWKVKVAVQDKLTNYVGADMYAFNDEIQIEN